MSPPPLLGTMLRMASKGGKITDNFNRTLSGSLGTVSSGGYNWSILTGTWDVNGSKPTTATSQSSNPVAVLSPNVSNVEVKLTVGAGDAIYFRVKDSSNWWRLLWEGYQTSSCQTCCSTCCSTCYSTCSANTQGCSTNTSSFNCGCSGCGNCTCSCNIGAGCSCYLNSASTSCTYSCNPYSCNCTSCNCTSCNCTYYDNYRLLTQKMVAGTLTTIHTSTTLQGSANATKQVSVITQGSTITSYVAGSQVYTGTQTDHQLESKHGIGRGASSYNASALDDFELNWR